MSEIQIKNAFRNKNGKAMIAFITGGDPDLATTEKLLLSMQEAGADLIEIGIPFSDPIAEGPVIQEANERALAAGCTIDRLFDSIKNARAGGVSVPMVFLTYVNPIVQYGAERFMTRCNECGMQGLIVPDLPFEEKGEIADVCRKHGVDIISMIAPTSEDRIRKIAGEATGFLYVVSSLGVTGVRTSITTDIDAMIRLVREASDIPAAVGFGIATPEQARDMAKRSDGAIVGSAIVKLVAKHGRECIGPVSDYVKSLAEAVHGI
ncbi:MAG: tryptophan synthase subunit alpha [Lachnospiraceae bacterium]|nr:tryptophan synthase subunit alpha [Lachnospiraceae bacterium]